VSFTAIAATSRPPPLRARGAADAVDDEDGVEADEQRRLGRIAPQAMGYPRRDGDRHQTPSDRDQLVDERRGADPEMAEQVAQRREQRAVDGRRELPPRSDVGQPGVSVAEHDGPVQVRVAMEDRRHPPVVAVAEDVGGEQWRGERHQHVKDDDRDHDPGRRQPSAETHEHPIAEDGEREQTDRAGEMDVRTDPPERAGKGDRRGREADRAG
jgi:hypothetical protein